MRTRRFLGSLIAAGALLGVGCTTTGAPEDHAHGAAAAGGSMGSGRGMPMGGHGTGAAPMMGDSSRMCDMYRQATAGKSPTEQQAAFEAQVKAMHGSADPQMVAMHRQMLEQRCASAGTGLPAR